MRQTPLIEIDEYNKIWAKDESKQLTGSVKYRAARYMIQHSYSLIKQYNFKVLESSSGNTGVAVAKVCKDYDLPCVIVLPKNTRDFIKKQIKSFGAQIIETPTQDGSDGAKKFVEELYNEEYYKYYYINQYNNDSNPLAHYNSTGPEIWEQTSGRVTHFIAGVGTGGTITGVGKYLKEQSPQIKIISVQPKNWGISGLRNLSESFIPEVYNENVIDQHEFVDTFEVVKMYNSENYPGGYSTIANFIVANEIPFEHTNLIVIMMPDGRMY